jgi:putative glutamine amidotransferase
MKKIIPLLFLAIFLLQSCEKDDGITIAISKTNDTEHYIRYKEWVAELCPEAEIINLYEMSLNDAESVLQRCDGLVLSGGPDVHPGRFGLEGDTARCGIDARRDTLEFMAAKYALEQKMPILAICRGEQLLNVVLGGSLVIDLPEDRMTLIHQVDTNSNARHDVFAEKGTEFAKITQKLEGTVNTNHHQAVNKLAEELKVSAYTFPDSIIEAYEWKNPEGKSPMIAVQWHPERLEQDNPFSINLGKKFIEFVKAYSDTTHPSIFDDKPEK